MDEVNQSLLLPDRSLPLLIQPRRSNLDPVDWARRNRSHIEAALHVHGALLFRDFPFPSLQEFEDFVAACSSGDPVAYREAATPRSHVQGNVFTSTEYPAQQRIYLHNENSHVTSWPLKLFFHCRIAATTGGETPLADCRRIFQRIPTAIREEFIAKKWMYRRSFGYGLGFPWTKVFPCRTREELDEYCKNNYMTAKWVDDEKLRIEYVRWAALKHPKTKESVWFNHGTFYNIWTLEPALKKAFLASFGELNMPYNTCYGDGTKVTDDVMRALDAAYHAETIRFPYLPGDVLLIDNMLVAHGRESFTGKREVFVEMTEQVRCEDLADACDYRVISSRNAP